MLPHPYDVPGYDIVLSGETFQTWNPLGDDTRHAQAHTCSVSLLRRDGYAELVIDES